jgi:hypothetical protein
MTSTTGDGVVARELFIPEQDLAEHTLLLRRWILGGERYRRELPNYRWRANDT